jgi:hypothetical protein
MRRRVSLATALAAALVLAGTACSDQLPTASDEGLFPGGRPVTFEADLEPAAFFEDLGHFTGYTTLRNAPYLLVAHAFDGALEAHTLARFTGFPTSVTYTADGASHTDSTFTWVGGRVVAPLDTAATTAAGAVTYQLWTVGDTWDAATVSWEAAADSVSGRRPWATPGGTRGRLLAEVSRAPGDTLLRDSIVWTLDSLAVRDLVADSTKGVLVTATGAATRTQLGGLVLRASARPAGKPDTTLTQSVNAGAVAFVFNPPAPDAEWQIGGVASARSLFRLTLPATVPVCPPAGAAGACRDVALGRVTLNEAALVFTPVAVPGGFRPVAPLMLTLRLIAEPELGRLAPLGGSVTAVTVPGRRFVAPADSTVAIPLTGYVQHLLSDSTAINTFALLAEPEAANFGVARFTGAPRLRLIYTLPLDSIAP